MAQTIQAIRGMNDLLPDQTPYWQQIEASLRQVIQSYGYQEIRFPIVESTQLFKRSIGEVTDIVEKEMYTFDDRNGDSLTLRPEGTASCVRTCLQHGLLHTPAQRLWYIGPMFRHERPQKGRYRQFSQIGVEAFGLAGPDIDAELILMTARFWHALGISEQVNLQINSLGSPTARQAYRDILVAYFQQHQDILDEDSKRRLTSNPLRILDSKNPAMQELIANAPSLLEHLDAESQQHFETLQTILGAANIKFTVNPRLVRGLDYYSHTVFEWVTDFLGAQGTVCAGGRYDGLVEQIGGKPTPAIGFAMGLERLILLYQEIHSQRTISNLPDIYLILVGEQAKTQGLLLAEQVHDYDSSIRVLTHCGEGSFKSQFKRADKSGARYALIIGDDEAAANTLSVKFLREDKPQITVAQSDIKEFLKNDYKS